MLRPRCSNCDKSIFPSYDSARAEAARLQEIYGKPIYFYPCPVGNNTHLTSKKKGGFAWKLRMGLL